MKRLALLVALSLTAALPACAHRPEAPAGPPDLSDVRTVASPQAAFYADCIAEAVGSSRYGRASDGDTEMVLFTCIGPPARAFFEALGPHSADVGSEVRADGRTLRSTNPVERDLFGVDYCSMGPEGGYRCVISLNAGSFLAR